MSFRLAVPEPARRTAAQKHHAEAQTTITNHRPAQLPAYQERFGADEYQAMLGNCLLGVYQMIGKLNPCVYVLRR